MDYHHKPFSDSELEQQLSQLYRSPAPDPDFTNRLERQLDERARQLAANQAVYRRRPWRDALGNAARWGWGPAGILLLIAVIIFAVSLLPKRPSALPQVALTQEITQTLPVSVTEVTATPTPPGSLDIPPTFETYRVVAGDTCASIALLFGVSVEELVQTNGLSPNCADIVTGQELRILYSTPTPVVGKPEVYIITRKAPVNLRSGPGVENEIVGILDIGEKLLKKGDVIRDGWVSVEYPPSSGATAWVWIELVIVIDPSDAAGGSQAPADWVMASNPRTLGDKLLVDVCFKLLDDGDWMIQNAILQVEQQDKVREVPYDTSTLISVRPFTTDSEGAHPGERCDLLEFTLDASTDLENAMLSVLALEAYPREGQDCDLYTERVQPLLTARETGILISCQPQEHASGNLTIVSKPDEMSLDAAQGLVYQAFLDTITLRGPWNFALAVMLSGGG